ncbi:MAG: hypothetical protein MJ240_08355, partial [Kiritimatiellae bacterium]|nr:hypothetical protein [Kiritimatiellia bacterium]
LGTNLWAGPFAMTTNIWTYSDHLVVSNYESVRVYFWDDANSNGWRDVWEATSTNWLNASGHTTVVRKSLQYGGFDLDNDNLPDWWEVEHGLSFTNALDAYLDFDGDGILNGQEFAIGTEPDISQGTNNLFYVLNRSIDERIAGTLHTNRVELYADIMHNGYNSNFIANTNFWLNGVDLSCSHIWSEYPVAYTNPFTPTSWRLTLIGPREVIYASHVDYYDENHGWTMPADRIYWFKGKSGAIYRRTLVARASIGCDISVGLLNETIPTNDVSPAVYFPTNFYRFAGNLKYIPQFFIDENSKAYVMSYEGVDLNVPNSIRYGKNYQIGNRMEYYKPGGIYSGSSSPQFMLVGRKPVLIGTLWKATGGSVFAPFHLNAIERKIHDLEGDNSFKVGTVDLNGFWEIQ